MKVESSESEYGREEVRINVEKFDSEPENSDSKQKDSKDSYYKIEFNMDESKKLSEQQKNSILRVLLEDTLKKDNAANKEDKSEKNQSDGNNTDEPLSSNEWKTVFALLLGSVIGAILMALANNYIF